jgi:diguanylate cyclase
MFMLPAAIGAFLLVNLVCACLTLAVVIAAGVWFFGARSARVEAQKVKSAHSPAAEVEKAAERAIVACSRLAELAQGVVSDVGDHAATMKDISAALEGVDRNESGVSQAVLAALDQIIAANAILQRRLDVAEKQIDEKTAEIRTHEADARTDVLTSLSNRRAFDDELRRRLSEWERKQTPLTLLLLDIDHFKKFNDTHGHLVGDAVLREVGKVLSTQSREMDLPCRYGGEEFGVIMPATSVAGACLLAERIRKAVGDSVTCCDKKKLKVTISIGVAQAMLGESSEEIIRRADEGLYKSKEAGRNCGHWHDGSRCMPICKPNSLAANAEPNSGEPPAATVAMAMDVRAASLVAFIQVLERRVPESHRFGIPLSLIHLTIEEFNVVSRTYGTAITRQILDVAENVIKKLLRETDTLSPLDNGEFVVMMPGSTQAEVEQAAERLRISMNDSIIPLIDGEPSVRFRHGIAELMANETAQEVLARARAQSDCQKLTGIEC